MGSLTDAYIIVTYSDHSNNPIADALDLVQRCAKPSIPSVKWTDTREMVASTLSQAETDIPHARATFQKCYHAQYVILSHYKDVVLPVYGFPY